MRHIRVVTFAICFALPLIAPLNALAAAPRVTAFVYQDSLAIAVDCSELLTPKRIDMLENGYPLSYVLTASLFEYQKIWSDAVVTSVSSRFRIVRRNWDANFELEFSDFSHEVSSQVHHALDDVVQELDDRLFTTLLPVANLDSTKEYYFVVNVEYRNLTFADVKSADRWLRNGQARLPDSASQDGSSIGDQVLGFLWDIAGLKGEKERVSGEKFRIYDLRRGK